MFLYLCLRILAKWLCTCLDWFEGRFGSGVHTFEYTSRRLSTKLCTLTTKDYQYYVSYVNTPPYYCILDSVIFNHPSFSDLSISIQPEGIPPALTPDT
jgi:hypothetical protein